MIFIPIVILCVIIVAISLIKKIDLAIMFSVIGASILIGLITYIIGVGGMSADQEVWSGYVVDWEHKEEYIEHIPAKWKTYYVTESYQKYDSTKKRTVTRTRRIKKKRYVPAKDVYHSATNRIKTTDSGWMRVYDFKGRKFNDNWPNTTEELKQMWKPNSPSASVHTYENKIQNSDSIYKPTEMFIDLYDKLPKYPLHVEDYIDINRMIGYFPNNKNASILLNQKNSDLNIMVDDPEKEGKKRAWKQINMIFVNLGDNLSEDYGFALKDYWGNGNKNDFIVCVSMGKDNIVDWVHIITWSESENLKIVVRDYLLDKKEIKDMNIVVEDISDMVAEMFERKQFADFNYINIEIPNWCYIFVIIYSILIFIWLIYFGYVK